MIPDRVFVTGTDTDVGKTIASAALCAALGHTYWKPVQSGTDDGCDRDTVHALAGTPSLPEAHRLPRPASPHAAAADVGVRLDVRALRAPDTPRLLVEGAGGWMVPFDLDPPAFTADLVRALDLPVIVVARTGLGTLNHTLLTLRAIRADGCTPVGLVLVGDAHPENERDLPRLGGVPVLVRLPRVSLPEGFPQLVSRVRAAAR